MTNGRVALYTNIVQAIYCLSICIEVGTPSGIWGIPMLSCSYMTTMGSVVISVYIAISIAITIAIEIVIAIVIVIAIYIVIEFEISITVAIIVVISISV